MKETQPVGVRGAMTLRERRGASAREFRAHFEEVGGIVSLVADEAAPPRTLRPFVISPVEGRLYNLLEATPRQHALARRLGFSFVPLEPPITYLDKSGTEQVAEIHAWKDGGALYAAGVRISPAEARGVRFTAITTAQRDELVSYGYSIDGPA